MEKEAKKILQRDRGYQSSIEGEHLEGNIDEVSYLDIREEFAFLDRFAGIYLSDQDQNQDLDVFEFGTDRILQDLSSPPSSEIPSQNFDFVAKSGESFEAKYDYKIIEEASVAKEKSMQSPKAVVEKRRLEEQEKEEESSRKLKEGLSKKPRLEK